MHVGWLLEFPNYFFRLACSLADNPDRAAVEVVVLDDVVSGSGVDGHAWTWDMVVGDGQSLEP